MHEKIISLLEENNSLLKEILAMLKKFDSEEYQSEQDVRQFTINVSANAVYELLKNNKELRDKINLVPSNAKYKVYIIDEVHQLSSAASSALLKTLEEPPEHVIFILATTNLESVPITIVSRCQRFEFHRITDKDIVERLKFVCDEENIKYEDDGLKEIAILADGGLRDALSILDQLSKNEEVITSTLVANEIGSISNKKIEDLVQSLGENDILNIEKIFDELQSSNLNYKVFVKKVIEVLSNLGVKLLTSPEVSRLSFDDCKNLVLELNNILMKINISVNPYTLIKMVMLGYVEKTNNFNKVSIEKVPEIREKNEEVKTEKIIKKEPVNTEKNLKVDIRINNCFVDASKKELERMKNLWSSFINNMEDAIMKGTLSDTIPVASSNYYTIIEVTIPHKDVELNNMLEKIEYLFNSQNQENFKFVFIDETRWSKEKVEYINNIKNGKKYEILEENQEKMKKSIDVSEVADIFDINKIEVE